MNCTYLLFFLFKAMTLLSLVHTPLRSVAEHVLATGDAPNKLYPLKIVAKMCYDAAGIKSVEEHSLIEKEMLNAYKGAQDGDQLDIDDNTDNVIQVYRYRDTYNNTKEVFAIGRFEERATVAQARAERTISQYPSRGVTMNTETKTTLEKFINKRMKRKAATAPPQAVAEGEGASQQAAKKKQKVVVEEVVEGDEEAGRQAEVASLNAKMDKLLKMDQKQQAAWLKEEKKRLQTRVEIADVQTRLTELGATSTRPEAMAVPEGNRTLYYILDGNGGTINYPEGSACILDSDIQGNLKPLPPPSGDDWNDQQIRKTRKYKLVTFGQTQYFVPVGAGGAANNWQVRKEDSYETLDNLRSLFDGEQSKFGEEALSYMAAGNVQGYGASWEFTETILVTWTKAILEQLGIDDADIDAASIAKGCPGRKTIANHEANLAADCMVVVMQEIIDDGAEHFCLITDHGKRSGLEHFVKLLVWCGWKDEKKEEKMLKFHCLDVDTSAHDAEGCAKAVKKSLEEFSGLNGFTITAITGDAGGGGAVQNLLPALVRIGAVNSGAVKINCLMHALNKCLELAGQETFGEQGINQRTPFQLLFVFNQLWKAIKEEGGGGSGGKAYLDEIYSIVTNNILNDGEWQQEANTNFKQAFKDFKEALATLEDLDDDEGIDDLVEFMTRTPSNIQDPVFSRWRTVMSCTRVVLKYWTQIYFMAVAIKQTEAALKKPTSSYLCTLSSALLSLMKEKNTDDDGAYYDPDNTVMADADVLTADDSDSDVQPPLKPNDTPVFYAMLLFFQAFGDAYFDDMFHFAMKDDPILDKGSYGQISRFCVERLYVMHKTLSELEGDGWKDRAEFEEYKNALEGFNAKNQAYFDKMSRVFLMRYRFVFEKHIEPCWRSNGVLPYIIGGNPTLANQFARWLFDDDNEAVAIDDDDVVKEYDFLDEDIDLGPFHRRTIAKKNVVINVKDCMLYLTAEADREAIKSTPFVNSHKELIKKMGQCNHEVNLLKKRTWGTGNDFSELEDAIWNEIAIHSCHQQRVEQFVQLAALVAKTNVKEARRTMRAIILSAIIRPFHLWAKQIIAERKGDDKLRRRVEGAVRGELFLKYMMAFRKKLERAKRLLEEREPGKYNAIKDRLTNQHNKASATLRSKKVEKMMSCIENGKRKITKGEQAEGYIDEPIIMSGNITFKLLTMTRSCQTCNDAWKKKKHTKCELEGCCMAAVHAELDKRNIKLSKKHCNELTITQKRHKIRDHEAKNVMVAQGKGEQGFNIKQVKHFKPQSELMKSLKPMQIEMLNVEKGLNLSWNSENT